MARTAATALLNHPSDTHADDFLTALAEGLVLSGLAMAVAGNTRPCSGACHEISHAIDRLFPAKSAPHGEQVGVGALFATFVRGDQELFAQMRTCLRKHNLPVSPEEIGLSIEEFAQAVHFAPQTRPDRFTLLEHLELSESESLAKVNEFIAAL